jgi:hypothetical protein
MRADDWTGATIRLRDGRKCYVQDGRTRYLAVHSEDDRLLEVDRLQVTMTRPPIGYTGPIVQPLGRPARSPWWAHAAAILAALTAALAVVGTVLHWWTW